MSTAQSTYFDTANHLRINLRDACSKLKRITSGTNKFVILPFWFSVLLWTNLMGPANDICGLMNLSFCHFDFNINNEIDLWFVIFVYADNTSLILKFTTYAWDRNLTVLQKVRFDPFLLTNRSLQKWSHCLHFGA